MNYYDIMICGTEQEKRKQNFDMMNLEKTSYIKFNVFKEFVTKIFHMYSATMTSNYHVSDSQIREVFDVLSNGSKEFNLKGYQKGLQDNPDLFDWLEKPKSVSSNFLSGAQSEKYSQAFVDDLLTKFNKF